MLRLKPAGQISGDRDLLSTPIFKNNFVLTWPKSKL